MGCKTNANTWKPQPFGKPQKGLSEKDFLGCEFSRLCPLIHFHGATVNIALTHFGSGASMSEFVPPTGSFHYH